MTSMERYRFILPIGDWSSDGHGQCEEFILESSEPVEWLRELHFRIKDELGFDIEAVCSNYQVDIMTEAQLADIERILPGFLGQHGINEETYVEAKDMAELWIALVRKLDATLELRITEEPALPTLMFYGNDAQGRHISAIGYGLFD